jgi:putative FmdB family regulatory protein
MPLYEYECGACGHRFEIIQKFSDGPPDACPQCGKGPLQRLQSSPAIQFKGTGWYVTDYAAKGRGSEKGGDGEKSEKGEKGGAEKKPADSKSDAASTDTGSKGDTKSDTKKSDAPASTPAAKD